MKGPLILFLLLCVPLLFAAGYPLFQEEEEDRTVSSQEQEADGSGTSDRAGKSSAADKEKRSSRRLESRGMAFKKGVAIGKAVFEDCTTRCHIDFPFKEAGRFSHSVHAPTFGFKCVLCHKSDPLPSEDHGKIALQKGGCRSCHHDPNRFPSCQTCHEPVDRTFRYKEVPFDHKIHTSKPEPPEDKN